MPAPLYVDPWNEAARWERWYQIAERLGAAGDYEAAEALQALARGLRNRRGHEEMRLRAKNEEMAHEMQRLRMELKRRECLLTQDAVLEREKATGQRWCPLCGRPSTDSVHRVVIPDA